MKELVKVIFIVILVIVSIIGTILLIDISITNEVYAASNSWASDLQLMARAINGEARGEPYEGQVAVRGGYIKSCEEFEVS